MFCTFKTEKKSVTKKVLLVFSDEQYLKHYRICFLNILSSARKPNQEKSIKAVDNLKVEIEFKMALQKQLDRQVKKKRKIEIPENFDIIHTENSPWSQACAIRSFLFGFK